MLRIKNLNVSADDTVILEKVSLNFDAGIHVIMGPNGAGKSTLGHAIMNSPFYKITGEVFLDGSNMSYAGTSERASRGIFLSFQNPTPIEGLSNFQLINQIVKGQVTSKLNGFKGLANEFSLPKGWEKEQLNVHSSGGEKKKNELIQMIMLDPKVVILDEPDSGLDIDSINILIDRINSFARKQNKCVIIISHYEKLLTNLEKVDSVTIITNQGAKQYAGNLVMDDILKNGFKTYAG